MAGYKKFRFSRSSYTPDAVWAGKHSMSEYRKEYQRLQRVAAKRLKAFEKAGRTESAIYKYAKEYIKPISALSDRDLSYALSDVYNFLTDLRGTVSGLKQIEKKAVDTLHAKWGFTSITTENIEDFSKYMDRMREKGLDKALGSARLAEIYAETAARKLPIKEIEEEFDYWVKHLDTLSSLPKYRSEKRTNTDYVKKQIEKAERKKEKERKKKNRRR